MFMSKRKGLYCRYGGGEEKKKLGTAFRGFVEI